MADNTKVYLVDHRNEIRVLDASPSTDKTLQYLTEMNWRHATDEEINRYVRGYVAVQAVGDLPDEAVRS